MRSRFLNKISRRLNGLALTTSSNNANGNNHCHHNIRWFWNKISRSRRCPDLTMSSGNETGNNHHYHYYTCIWYRTQMIYGDKDMLIAHCGSRQKCYSFIRRTNRTPSLIALNSSKLDLRGLVIITTTITATTSNTSTATTIPNTTTAFICNNGSRLFMIACYEETWITCNSYNRTRRWYQNTAMTRTYMPVGIGVSQTLFKKLYNVHNSWEGRLKVSPEGDDV